VIAEALTWTLIHSLWQGGLVVAVVAAAGPRLARRSASARYLVYCAALAAIPAMAALTFASIYNAGDAGGALPWRGADPSQLAGSAGAGLISQLAPWLVAAWLTGVAACCARLIAGCGQVHRLRRDTQPLPAPWDRATRAAIARLSQSLAVRAAVDVAASAAVTVPTLAGWLRPVILLPIGLVARLSPAQLEAVLAHELAHARRYDTVVNLAQSVIEAVLFYHPGARWLSARIRVEREYCCDDLAVGTTGDPLAYSLTLIELEALRGAAPQPAAAALATAAIDPRGGPLMSRIRRLVTPNASNSSDAPVDSGAPRAPRAPRASRASRASRALVSSAAARSRAGGWLAPLLLAAAVLGAATVAACEGDPEPAAEHEFGLSGGGLFIDESGAVTEVGPDHVWVPADLDEANAIHPHGAHKIDSSEHGGLESIVHNDDGSVTITMKDGTVYDFQGEVVHGSMMIHEGEQPAP
jgi:beta-lactamase regulating signal transducer with metallopeptidase domain